METDKQLLSSLFTIAVDAADPKRAIPQVLPPKPQGRVVVIGAGKASARMAEVVESVWGPCDGLVITRYGYSRPTKGVRIVEASHPTPDEAGLRATQEMLSLLEGLREDDFVLALISGGASSLLCAPCEGVSLQEKQQLHADLLSSGAPISAMNVIRKHFSRSKGGQLAAAAYPAAMLALLISDVPGDDLREIGSGPTVGEDGSLADAIKMAAKIGVTPPNPPGRTASSVVSAADERLSRVENRIIAAPSQSLAQAKDAAQARGIEVQVLGDAIEGEAREVAAEHVKQALGLQSRMSADDKPVLLLSGGECTVAGRGSGVGGPNAEYALAAAIELNGAPGVSLIACDTDGVDGAADIAGAFVDETTLARAKEAGVSAPEALAEHDSHGFFAAFGDGIVTGPTQTNVNDFRAILIHPRRA